MSGLTYKPVQHHVVAGVDDGGDRRLADNRRQPRSMRAAPTPPARAVTRERRVAFNGVARRGAGGLRRDQLASGWPGPVRKGPAP